MSKTVSVIEYERVSKDKLKDSDYKHLKNLCFDEQYKDILNCYNGKICFKNYAGVLQLKNDTFIEILPKICFADSLIDKSRKIFTKMIAVLKSDYYKAFSETHISADKFPLLEVFIKIFLDELDNIVKKGLKRNYVKTTENSLFIKGKVKILQNIKYNYLHKEKNYIEYSKYIANIPENIILRTCIEFLKSKSNDFDNIKRLNQMLFLFDNIPISRNIDVEFKKVCITRLNQYYESALELAKVFLSGNSYLPKQGNTELMSLMFPMQKIFEDYIFFNLRKTCKNNFKKIKAQSHPYYLIDSHKKFNLKPDITMDNDDKIMILDTKWKLVDSSKIDGKCGVSQSDLYQLYAYGKKYQRKTDKNVELYLIYPKTEKFQEARPWNFEDDKSLPITIVPYDLEKDKLLLD